MEAVREITEWSMEYNHDYLLDGDRIVAYRKQGQGPVIAVSGRLKLDRRGRKFQKLDRKEFAGFDKKEEKSPVVEVKGSKGNSYYVNVEEKSCTCPGFVFRGACRHVVDILAQ